MRSEKTLAELQAWIDAYATPDAPDAQTLADFLGIELAEPAPPVGQRRRSPSGVEVVKTDDDSLAWRKYRGSTSDFWFDDEEVADWQVITDAPAIDLSGWADDDLRVPACGELGASLRAELAIKVLLLTFIHI